MINNKIIFGVNFFGRKFVWYGVGFDSLDESERKIAKEIASYQIMENHLTKMIVFSILLGEKAYNRYEKDTDEFGVMRFGMKYVDYLAKISLFEGFGLDRITNARKML